VEPGADLGAAAASAKAQDQRQTIYRHIRRDRKAGGTCGSTRASQQVRTQALQERGFPGVLRGKRHISERPKAVARRRQIGHWEADTVMARPQHCLLTMVERATGTRDQEADCAQQRAGDAALLRALSGHESGSRPSRSTTHEFHDYKVLEQQFGSSATSPRRTTRGARQQRKPERTDQAVPSQGHVHEVRCAEGLQRNSKRFE